MDAGTLHNAIAEVCPVDSVSVGKSDDRATWSFDPDKEATPEQIAAGNNVIATIPVDYKPPPAPNRQDEVLYSHENRIRSLEGQPPLSLVEFITKTKVKS